MLPLPRSIPIKSACLVVLFAAVTSATPALAQGVEFEPELIKVMETDSLFIVDAAVSPDNRWIVFSAGPDLAQCSLFAIPADGGQLKRLTDMGFHDIHPQWSPDGRYIYFLSDRITGPTGNQAHIFRIPFDGSAGANTDVPRPVTLSPSSGRFNVSPDGAWIAFFSRNPGGGSTEGEIRVTPSSGGPSRTLAQAESAPSMGWSADGQRVIYALRIRTLPSSADEPAYQIWQVGVEGGPPELLASREGMLRALHRSQEEALWTTNYPQSYSSFHYFITDLSGKDLGSFSVPPGVRISVPEWSGHQLAAQSGNSGMPIFIVPLDGQEARLVSGLGVDGDPEGWMPDGRLMVDATVELSDTLPWDLERTFYAFDPASGAMTHLSALDEFKISFGDIAFDDSGTTAFIRDDGHRYGGERGSGTVLFLDLDTGVRRSLAQVPGGDEGPSLAGEVYGRGGRLNRDGDQFYYLVWRPDRRELFRASPATEPDLVWTFRQPSRSYHFFEQVAVHGDRIAWVDQEGTDSLSLSGNRIMLGNLTTGEAREFYRSDGSLGRYVVWSNDGRRLAFGSVREGKTDLAILEVDAAGTAMGEPKVVRLGTESWYNLNWLPGDEAVALLAMGMKSDIDTDILLVDLRSEADEPVRVLTEDDPYSVWVFSLSPDGRSIAYGSERPAMETLYRLTLPDFGGR